MSKSLDNRRDHRTEKQFKKDISTWEAKEDIWAETMKAEMEQCGHKVEFEHYGIGDGTGKMIENATVKDLSRPDKKFIIDGETHLVEIKTCDMGKDYPNLPFITIKTNSMKSAIKEENGKVVICDREWWMILRKDVLEKLLEAYPHKIYHGFSPKNKAIRVPGKDLAGWLSNKREDGKIEIRRWNKDAEKVIKKHADKLFRKAKYTRKGR